MLACHEDRECACQADAVALMLVAVTVACSPGEQMDHDEEAEDGVDDKH